MPSSQAKRWPADDATCNFRVLEVVAREAGELGHALRAACHVVWPRAGGLWVMHAIRRQHLLEVHVCVVHVCLHWGKKIFNCEALYVAALCAYASKPWTWATQCHCRHDAIAKAPASNSAPAFGNALHALLRLSLALLPLLRLSSASTQMQTPPAWCWLAVFTTADNNAPVFGGVLTAGRIGLVFECRTHKHGAGWLAVFNTTATVHQPGKIGRCLICLMARTLI